MAQPEGGDLAASVLNVKETRRLVTEPDLPSRYCPRCSSRLAPRKCKMIC